MASIVVHRLDAGFFVKFGRVEIGLVEAERQRLGNRERFRHASRFDDDVIERPFLGESRHRVEEVAAKSKIPPAKAPQTMQTGDIDATMIQEPFATVSNNDGFREVA